METIDTREVINALLELLAARMKSETLEQQEQMLIKAEDAMDSWFTDNFEAETRNRDTSGW